MENSTERQAVLASLCLMGDSSQELFAFLGKKQQEQIQKVAEHLERKGGDSLRSLHRAQPSPLEEVHPDWIVEKLEGESPRVLDIIRGSSYNVSSGVKKVVRKIVEKKFAVARRSIFKASARIAFSFGHLSILKSDDLRTLFSDLGLDELRKAFTGVDPRTLKAFLARFTPREALMIRERIQEGTVSSEQRVEAQKVLAGLSFERLGSESLFREVGY
ncbi:MAG: hypothetical protein HY073_03720, partial [Deltaproteobacteria bacterium]|nr:hypothetical protein [Deltaproteobacteria bacterium]